MELITSGTLKYLKRSFRSTRFIRGHPFYWTSELGPEVDHTKVTRAHCSLNFILGLMYTCFVIFRAFQVLLDSETTPTKMIYIIFLTVYYLILLSYQAVVMLKKDELVCFTRGFCRFIENKERNLGGNSKGKILKLGAFIIGISFWTFNANIPVLCALSILQPKSPEFLSSLFTNEHGELNWTARSLSTSFQTYLSICMVQAGLVCVLSMLFSTFITIDLMDRVKNRAKIMSLQKTTLLRIHTELKLLVEFYNDLFPLVIVGGHISIIILVVLCTHIAVRSDGWISIICGYFGLELFVSLILVISCLAEINRRSSSMLEMMRERADKSDKILHRKLKSMRALRIRAGSFFFYDKMLVITTVQIGVENAYNLLLMY